MDLCCSAAAAPGGAAPCCARLRRRRTLKLILAKRSGVTRPGTHFSCCYCLLGSFANAALQAKRYGLAVSHWTPEATTREKARKDAQKEAQEKTQDAVPLGPQAHQAFSSFSVAGDSGGGNPSACAPHASECASAPASPNSGISRCSGAAAWGSSVASPNENESARQLSLELSKVLWFTHVNCGTGSHASDSDAASETVSHGPLGGASNADNDSVSSSPSDVVM